ncbi:MAG: hypothetical protein IIZ78_02975 [Clostridiales bacterium]|nr:hypothetical protein [Clostridiales bacterium]
MTTFWLIVLTVGFVAQGWYIHQLEDEIEAIKSWYPFCEILKIKIPEKDDFERREE